MKTTTERSPLTFAPLLLLATALFTGAPVSAQTPDPPTAPRPERGCAAKPETCQTQTFYLANVSQQNDANEILVALRNILPPWVKIFLTVNQNAIVLNATPDEIQLAQRLITDLDRPHKIYRVTFTITESDGGKRIGTQHFSMIMAAGQRTSLKQGSKVPVVTGSYNSGAAGNNAPPGVQTQYTYLDVGMNFDATITEVARGAILRSKVEQSSVADQKIPFTEADPVVRQTVIESSSFLTANKPVILGTVDIVGSTRHVDISAMMEPLP